MTSGSKLDRVMTQEQFVEVVDAILNGKYSWACVLILRFAGYNPLHYIPYRTYNRLMKEHCKGRQKNQRPSSCSDSKEVISTVCPSHVLSRNMSSNISDLDYLELAGKKTSKVQGGTISQWLNERFKYSLN